MVNTASWNRNFRQDIVDKLAKELAIQIIESNIATQENKFHTEYEISVIVATPNDFYKAIAEHGNDAALGIPIYYS